MEGLLYKYLDIKGAKLMLEHSNLQFTPATKLNDPFDCYQELLDYSTYELRWHKEHGVYPDQKEEFEKLRKNSLVCCLSKTKKSILMWSYYNQHRGICIGLDIDKVLNCLKSHYPDAIDSFRPFEVTYSESFTKLDYAKHQNYSFRHIIRQKAIDWCHEEEVRMIVLAALVKSENRDEYSAGEYWRPKIEGQCFVSIYLGVNIFDDDKAEIIRLARELNPDIKIYQMKVNPNAFQLDYEEIA